VNESGRVFPQVKLENLKCLPVAIPNMEQLEQFEQLCLAIENNTLIKVNGKETIDTLIYQLYNLSAEEIAVVEAAIK
jgi:hypothetical protein